LGIGEKFAGVADAVGLELQDRRPHGKAVGRDGCRRGHQGSIFERLHEHGLPSREWSQPKGLILCVPQTVEPHLRPMRWTYETIGVKRNRKKDFEGKIVGG
jgi:hypothetical protein